MNPLEAFQLIMNAAALAPMPKQSHVQVEQAGAALRDYIAESMKPPKEVKVPDAPKAAAGANGKKSPHGRAEPKTKE